MSGEGSSSGVKRKRRTTRAQTAAQEQPDAPVLREIRYRDAGVPHGQSERLVESPLLRFEVGSYEFMKFEAIKKVKLLESKRIDWDLVRKLGQVERVQELLGDKFRWAVECELPQYLELTMEFHSTFIYRHPGGFDQPDVVSFALGKHVYNMSLIQFAEATGLYSAEEVGSDEFRGLLRQVVREPAEACVLKEDLARFWRTIAISPYSSNLVASDIRDPVYRFVHKILCSTLIGKHEGDKVNQHSLFCLMCMVERRPANLASILAWSLARPKKGGGTARLYGGSYITMLAANLGVFAEFPAERMTEGPAPSLVELRSLQLARIVTFIEPLAWTEILPAPPSPDPTAEEAATTTIPERYQVPLQRHQLPAREYPFRQPRPEPLTLEGLYDRVEQVRHEMQLGFQGLYDYFHIQLPPILQPQQGGPAGGEEEPAGGEQGSAGDA
ncbi:hypothetical protein HanXRQr2_Chr17g0825301 [Helianthus annuus]|uniref:Uncharacterized protein n=1 Tax=Helianthus annuus TaxID=4232 RepID=A0A9K3DNL6_HELAN|nr:hypothetical protein HanXRQr2_Chr17g0825301 [Helianthus annuus]KAJ0449147.1 hypothetical protein HanHA89_Chr17g0725121 [Helianthus annuus]